jgi:crotonobetainyl-CoA:carnitine CoA-transferase CaiB-like acyl-CoA transferase
VTGLDAVAVLDFSIWRPGPYATQLLAERGANVLKIEPPGGDPMRAYPGLFDTLNARKRLETIDLKTPAGVDRALELAAMADVVVEGYRPGVAARLGIGYDAVRAVRPNVVYCSISGLGQDGPLAAASGHDINYMAWAGVLAPEGGPPRVPAIPVADLAGGMAAALAISAALVGRQTSGEGAYLDIAMSDVLATWTGPVAPVAAAATPEGTGRGVPGYGPFEVADGHVVLGIISEDHFWAALCGELGLDDVSELRFDERLARVDELQSRVRAALAAGQRDDLVARLLAVGVPVAPVLTRAQMIEHPHFVARKVFDGGA